jgi:arsenate reductase
MDFVITVCDNAAGEICPVWPGHPTTAHWGFQDPAALRGSDAQRRAGFAAVYRQIAHRIRLFSSLPVADLHPVSLQQKLRHLRSSPP